MPVYCTLSVFELEAQLKTLEGRIDRIQSELAILRNPASLDAFRLASQLCAQQIRRMGCNCDGRLVRNGLAVAYVKYSTDYLPQEVVARGARLGIWSGAFVPPAEWRKGKR